MAPPPSTYITTSKRRKRDKLTSDASNDSDSDYNPRKLNRKPKPKLKSFRQSARDHSIFRTSTSLPFQPPHPYRDATNEGEDESAAEATHLPTPPKISLFSKFGKRAKTGKEITLSSAQGSKSKDVSGSSFTAAQQPAPTTSKATQALPQSMLNSTGNPIPTINLLPTYATRSATGSHPSAFPPNYAEPSLSSLDSSDFVADLRVPSTAQHPFPSGTKKGSQATIAHSTPAVTSIKPSGIKLRFNIKSKTAPAKKASVADDSIPSVVPSPNTTSQKSKSSYTPPVFGSDHSFSILRTRYQSSPPESQNTSGSIRFTSQGSFMSRLVSSPRSQQPDGSFDSVAHREPTSEDRLFSALQAEIGSDSEAKATDGSLLEQILNKNADFLLSDSGSDCDIDPDILAQVEAEEADMNGNQEVEVVQQERQPFSCLSYALYMAENQELTKTTEKLYWLQMQAQWAERAGVKNEFLAGLDVEILHSKVMKLRLEQRLGQLPFASKVSESYNE